MPGSTLHPVWLLCLPTPSQMRSCPLAGALNLFWGVLKWKKVAEEALEASNMSYLIVRPGECTRLEQEPCISVLQLHQVRTGAKPCLRPGEDCTPPPS